MSDTRLMLTLVGLRRQIETKPYALLTDAEKRLYAALIEVEREHIAKVRAA